MVSNAPPKPCYPPSPTSACACALTCVRAPCSVGWAYEIIQSAPNKEINASPKKYADNFKWKGPKGRNFPDLYKPPPPPPPPPANK